MKERNITIFAVLYTVLVYAAPALFYAVVTFLPDFLKGLAYVILFIPVALAVINVIYIKKNFNALSRDVLLRGALIVKYVLIPFYIVGGINVALFALMMFTPVVFMVFLSPVIIGVLCFFGWIYLVGGTVFSLAYIIKAKKEKAHGTVLSVIGGIMQFFFAMDVISLMILSIKDKKYIPVTITLILVTVIGSISAVAWLVLTFMANI